MRKLFSILAISLTIGSSGCKKDFLDLENNPNTPSVASPQFVLSGAQKVTADILNTSVTSTASGMSTYGVWMGYWTSSGNYVPNASLMSYNFTNSDYQSWSLLYNNLSNYNYLETTAAADKSLANFQAIAQIMKAFGFQALVDIYNNVPYSEAFKASKNISPAYDKGEVIYDDLLKQLDAAIALIKASGSATNPGSSDIIFHGNMTNWVKFANTLKLRIALRQWNKFPGKQAALKTAVTATAPEGYLDESIQAAANPGYTNDDANGGKQSPFYKAYGYDQNGNATTNNDYYRASAYAVNKLRNTNDPRLTRFYATLPDGSVRGNVYGESDPQSNATTSGIGPGLLISPNMDAVLLSSAEALFLQSEWALNDLKLDAAKSFYERGIAASFVAAGVPDAATAAVAYYSQPGMVNVNYDASPNKLEAIITQKWTALNGFGTLEAYNEYRRTGYPADIPLSLQAAGSNIPTRIFYPSSEYAQNAANVAKEGTINQFTSKIFWAK